MISYVASTTIAYLSVSSSSCNRNHLIELVRSRMIGNEALTTIMKLWVRAVLFKSYSSVWASYVLHDWTNRRLFFDRLMLKYVMFKLNMVIQWPFRDVYFHQLNELNMVIDTHVDLLNWDHERRWHTIVLPTDLRLSTPVKWTDLKYQVRLAFTQRTRCTFNYVEIHRQPLLIAIIIIQD